MSARVSGILLSGLLALSLGLLLSFVSFAARPAASFAASHEPQAEQKVIFLVRHAEKETAGFDPDLTPAGQVRAMMLAGLLKDARLDHVHSTGFKRTRKTAKPVAEAAGLTVQVYDPADLGGLAAMLLATGGRHLVVGHSNTATKMVELLGGDPGFPIDDTSEFDRLYVLSLSPGGVAQTVLLRY